MPRTRSTKRAKAVAYVMKESFIQVLIPGKGPFTLNKTHPTFNKLKAALKAKKWKQVPRLVNLAESIAIAIHGEVEVTNGVVKYKGRPVHSTLTDRILDMIKHEKPIKHMLKFMDNLYLNPSDRAVHSFYDWLVDNGLPITDDGCFLAYKSVDWDFKDTHTKSVDNRPGQIIMMSRKVANTDYDNQCSTGFHVCSKKYGLYGTRVLAVKVNPKHVLSAPEGGKMRVTQYEVLRDMGRGREDFSEIGLAELEGVLVIEVGKERKDFIQKLLKAEPVKRLIRRKKLSKTSILKASYARLEAMLQRFSLQSVPKIGPEKTHLLLNARKASGVTIGQLAKEMGVSYKTVVAIEKKDSPTQTQRDDYLKSLGRITGSYNITFPKTSAAVA